jgi:hypothetical protein
VARSGIFCVKTGDDTIGKLHVRRSFEFSPPSLAVSLPQPLTFADGFAGGNQLDVGDAPGNLEVLFPCPRRLKAAFYFYASYGTA